MDSRPASPTGSTTPAVDTESSVSTPPRLPSSPAPSGISSVSSLSLLSTTIDPSEPAHASHDHSPARLSSPTSSSPLSSVPPSRQSSPQPSLPSQDNTLPQCTRRRYFRNKTVTAFAIDSPSGTKLCFKRPARVSPPNMVFFHFAVLGLDPSTRESVGTDLNAEGYRPFASSSQCAYIVCNPCINSDLVLSGQRWSVIRQCS